MRLKDRKILDKNVFYTKKCFELIKEFLSQFGSSVRNIVNGI